MACAVRPDVKVVVAALRQRLAAHGGVQRFRAGRTVTARPQRLIGCAFIDFGVLANVGADAPMGIFLAPCPLLPGPCTRRYPP